MPRRIANGLTLLSAVVCVGSALLVGRSVFRADIIEIPIARSCLSLTALDALLFLSHRRSGYRDFTWSFSIRSYDAAALRPGNKWWWRNMKGVRWLGFGFDLTSHRLAKDAILPLWLLPLLTAIAPVRWWRARRRAGGRGFPVEGAAASAA